MILFDLSQILNANVSMMDSNEPIDEGLLRHMVLSTIRKNMRKFKDEYGPDVVIAVDMKDSWRRTAFPYYKGNRKKSSKINWTKVYEHFNTIIAELEEFFPYRVVYVEKAEADDVIAVLVKHLSAGSEDSIVMTSEVEPIIIISGDKDFQQLHRYPNVKQWSPVMDKFLKTSDPEAFLIDHVINGDKGDGVPNVLSDDDTYTSETKRARAMTEIRRKTLFDSRGMPIPGNGIDGVPYTTIMRNWKRNASLIDLNNIPEPLADQIVTRYESEAGKGRSKMFNYFITRRLRQLQDSIMDF